MLEAERWVEAEEWLAYHYPEHKWEVKFHNGNIYVLRREYLPDRIGHIKCVPEDVFRKWVAKVDFNYAMTFLSVVHFPSPLA